LIPLPNIVQIGRWYTLHTNGFGVHLGK
jgi:hypothetical protein